MISSAQFTISVEYVEEDQIVESEIQIAVTCQQDMGLLISDMYRAIISGGINIVDNHQTHFVSPLEILHLRIFELNPIWKF